MDDAKFFEAAQSLAQGLSQWDLLIIAGSMVVIVSTTYYRPTTRRMRLAYLLFLPAWACLAGSIYEGIRIQGSYVAYLVAARYRNQKVIEAIAAKINDYTQLQLRYLEFALLCLAVWLVTYILWWIFSKQAQLAGGSK